MIVPSLNFKFLIKQKRKFKWVSLSFFSQTGTYSLTALVYKPFLSCEVMLYSVIVIQHFGTAQIGGSGNSRTPIAPADHFCFQMVDCHSFSPSLRFCFFFAKRKWVSPEKRYPYLRQSCRWQVFAGSWRKAGVQTVPLLTDAKAGVLAITAWAMTAESTGLWHRPAAPAGDAIPLGLHPQVRFGGQPPQAALGPEMSARARPTGGLPPPALAGGE